MIFGVSIFFECLYKKKKKKRNHGFQIEKVRAYEYRFHDILIIST